MLAWCLLALLALWVVYRERRAPVAVAAPVAVPVAVPRKPRPVGKKRRLVRGSLTGAGTVKEIKKEVAETTTEQAETPNFLEDSGDAPTESERRENELKLLAACKRGDVETARRLLETEGVDVNAREHIEAEYDGDTALILSVKWAHDDVMALLLRHGADVNAISNKVALDCANDPTTIQMLLDHGADTNVHDHYGDTPLHFAVRIGVKIKTLMLLQNAAAVDAVNNNGYAPIHVLLQQAKEDGGMAVNVAAYHDIAHILVSFGAKWDDTCDGLVDENDSVSRGFRVALHWWIDEYTRGAKELTEIPEEVLLRGPDSVKQYLAARHASGRIIHRRKVCVVGPSFWGKTILVKSIAEGIPSLEHPEDRTIGIDQFPLSFGDRSISDEELLIEACLVGDIDAVQCLIEMVDVHAAPSKSEANESHKTSKRYKESEGLTPLHCAVKGEHLDVVQFLLGNGADPDIKSEQDGSTPLHQALLGKNIAIVEALLAAGANPNLSSNGGDAPLHVALNRNFTLAAQTLLEHGASINAVGMFRNKPLHYCYKCPEMTTGLLKAGADIDATNQFGEKPLHGIINEVVSANWSGGHSQIVFSALESAARALVANGATWDEECDETVEDEGDVAQALREAVLVWAEERTKGTELTRFPYHVYMGGPASIRQSVADKNKQPDSDLAGTRAPGSLDGIVDEIPLSPSQTHNSGQRGFEVVSQHTSATTRGSPSVTTKAPRSIEELNIIPRHEVTFWDFAGQEAYQVAHSAFFSKRTLYLVCVDLQSYAVAREQAEFRADKDSDFDRFVDEFVESKILRWIRLILASQPDAEFVFVGTKADVIGNVPDRIRNSHEDLSKRVKAFASTIESKSCDMDERLQRLHVHSSVSAPSRTRDTQFSRALDASVKRLLNIKWLKVNCRDKASVIDAKKAIEQIIITSERSFQMPDQYSQVLDAITSRRVGLAGKSPSDQVTEAFMPVSAVYEYLRTKIPDLSDDGCCAILRTLHDIGDVLWFEDLGIDYLKETVILHPLVLIELVRQVVHHNHSCDVITHSALKELVFWNDLDPDRILAMKQLLQQFHLVIPIGDDMEWDSDLLVPAFWRSKESALWLFLGDQLKNDPSLDKIHNDICVQWEYHFLTALPEVVFDELVIESYTSLYTREAGPDWLLYKVEDQFACRVVVTRASGSLQRVLRLEAVASASATTYMWGRFEHVCESLESVLSRYKGLVVSRCVVDDNGRELKLEALVDEWMRTPPRRREPKRWLPPSLEWYYTNVMSARSSQQRSQPMV